MTWAVFVDHAYCAARDWGHSWRDFMDLPIPFWWTEFDGKLRMQKKLEQAESGKTPGLGGFSKADWAEAKKRHKEMKNG